MEDILHIKVGCGMDGMEQRPEVAQWVVLTTELALDGTEGLYHDLLTLFLRDRIAEHAIATSQRIAEHRVAIVAAGRDDLAVGDVRLRVANEDDGEHIHILGVKGTEGGHTDSLILATSLTDITHRSVGTALLQEEFLQTVELPVAAMRLGVVDGGDKVTYYCRLDAALYLFPGSHQVGEGDDAEVVTDGGTQQRGGLLEGGDAGEDFDGNARRRTVGNGGGDVRRRSAGNGGGDVRRRNVGSGGGAFVLHLSFARIQSRVGRVGASSTLLSLLPHFEDEGSHAVDAGIARANDDDGLALFGQEEGLLGTLALLLHACVDALATLFHVGLDKLEIVFVAHNGIRPPYCFEYGGRDVLLAAGAYACYDDLSHVACFDLSHITCCISVIAHKDTTLF